MVAVKKVAVHPTYFEMIAAAIKALKKPGKVALSRQAILKYIEANFKVGDNAPVALRLALRRLVDSKKLVAVKGSFKLGEAGVAALKPKPKKVVKKKVVKKVVKKKVAKKPVKKVVKKPVKKVVKKKVVKKPVKKVVKKVVKKPVKKVVKKAVKKVVKKPVKK